MIKHTRGDWTIWQQSRGAPIYLHNKDSGFAHLINCNLTEKMTGYELDKLIIAASKPKEE